MKRIEELTECYNVLIANKKDWKSIKKQLGKASKETIKNGIDAIGFPIVIRRQGTGFTWGGTSSILTVGTKQIPASKFLKPSLKKRVKELELKLTSISEQLFDLTKFNTATETNDVKGLEVHFDEVEKLPEKWCVKHYPETLEWIRNNAELNGSHIYERCYYMFPANGSGNNSSNIKPDGYPEISFETFMKFVYKQDEKPVELEVGKWYKNPDTNFIAFIAGFEDEDFAFGYGFNEGSEWFTDRFGRHNLSPATDEEVKEALIAEAERRGFKEGVDYKAVGEHSGQTNTLDDSEWRHNIGNKKPSLCKLGLGRVFFDGKWAEIISAPEIDFSKAGQLVVSTDEDKVLVLTLPHKRDVYGTFTGIVLSSNGAEDKGEYSNDWASEDFTLYHGELTLSN